MLWIEGKSSNPEAENGDCPKCPGRVECCRVSEEDGIPDSAGSTGILHEAMEASQNYENSAQSLQKSLKASEKRERSKLEDKTGRTRDKGSIRPHPTLPVPAVPVNRVR